jgi:flagellin
MRADLIITIGGVNTNVGASVADGVSTVNATSSALAFANAINTAGTGVQAVVGGATGEGAASQVTKTVVGDATDFVKINGINVGAFITTTSNEAIDVINAVSGQTGVTATRTSTDKITLTNTSGANLQVEAGVIGATASGFATSNISGTIQLRSKTAFSISGADVGNLNLASTTGSLTTDNVQTLSIATKADANTAILTVDAALSQLNEKRTSIGAQVNRLNSVVNSLSSISENVAASNSRILDADCTSETASLTRTQVLQKASATVLSQANQTPQLAHLTLLR